MARLRRNILNPDGFGFYHCLSRVVDRNFVFGPGEREVFRKILRQVQIFSGVRMVTWTILSNHFHVLVEVAKVFASGGELSLAQLLQCTARYLSDGVVIGTEAFVEEFFQSRRELFSARREEDERGRLG